MSHKVLINFCHGLGDSVQLSVILQHLAKVYPDWEIDVTCKRGKHSAVKGLCHTVYHDGEPQPRREDYDEYYNLEWWECYHVFEYAPSTKASNCLQEVFGLLPEAAICHYKMNISQDSLTVAENYLKGIGCKKLPNGKYNAVLIHYEGNTSQERKNLTHETGREICNTCFDYHMLPVVLDWDRRSPLPDGRKIFNPGTYEGDIWGGFGSGDAERIAALVQMSSMFIGVDSGPQKCAACTDTPCIGIWTRHAPVQFFDLSDNFLHLVPEDWRDVPPNYDKDARKFFEENYRYQTYTLLSLPLVILQEMERVFGKPTLPETPISFSDFIVGIPTLNRYDLLKQCVKHIAIGTVRPKKILIIDNGGNCPTDEINERWAGVEFIFPEKNLGVAASWNVLCKLADPLPIVLINDDVMVGEQTLEALMRSESPIASACPSSFSCIKIRQDVLKKIGLFDETFYPAYMEDNDMSWRMRLEGYQIEGVGRHGLVHYSSSTINAMGPGERGNFESQWSHCFNYYVSKWGGSPDSEVYRVPFDANFRSKWKDSKGMIAVAHPGKMGDALYALPAVKWLCKKYGCKADFYTSEYCKPLTPLLEYQPYINKAVIPEEYRIEHMGCGIQPWHMPIPEDNYDAVFQLGFKQTPDKSLHDWIRESVGISEQLPVAYECPEEHVGFYDIAPPLNQTYVVLCSNGETSFKPLFEEFVQKCPFPIVHVGKEEIRGLFNVAYDIAGLSSFLNDCSWIKNARAFVGLMSSNLVLANGFDVLKVAPHDGVHWDMRHVIKESYNWYPINPTAQEIVDKISFIPTYCKTLHPKDYIHLWWEGPQIHKTIGMLQGTTYRMEHTHRMWEYGLGLQIVYRQKPKTMLDVGGGGSVFAPTVARQDVAVTVVDPGDCSHWVTSHKARINHKVLNYIQKDFLDWESEEQFDMVACISVMEHVQSDIAFFKKLLSKVGAGGVLYLTVDFHSSGNAQCGGHLKTYDEPTLLALIGLAQNEGFMPFGDPDYSEQGGHVNGYNFASLALRRS